MTSNTAHDLAANSATWAGGSPTKNERAPLAWVTVDDTTHVHVHLLPGLDHPLRRQGMTGVGLGGPREPAS